MKGAVRSILVPALVVAAAAGAAAAAPVGDLPAIRTRGRLVVKYFGEAAPEILRKARQE